MNFLQWRHLTTPETMAVWTDAAGNCRVNRKGNPAHDLDGDVVFGKKITSGLWQPELDFGNKAEVRPSALGTQITWATQLAVNYRRRNGVLTNIDQEVCI